ncbi:ribosome biogenesis GTPase YqeH [Aerococcaceae bacterium WGS1372]
MVIGGTNLTEQTYQCIGCGATIQTTNPDEVGYLPQSALNKGLEKGEFYCQRCFRLRHYNELQDLDISDDVFLNKLSEIAHDDAFVVLVVDIFDVEGSIISGLHRFIGNQKFIVAANKFDLLPKVTRHSKVKDWVRQTVNRHGLYPEEVILTHGNKESGILDLAKVIEKEIQRNNVYIVGVTNVGKSTLINQLIRHYGGEKEVITTSNHPGTTLDLIQIPLTDKHAIIDTPGIIRRTQLAHYLSREDIRKVLPQKEIKPKTFQLNEGQTIFLGGLARVDLIKSEASKSAVTFYVSNDLYLHRTKTDNADVLYEQHIGELLSPPNKEGNEHLPKLTQETYHLNGDEDISISGLGWFTTNSKVEINLHYIEDINVAKRQSII